MGSICLLFYRDCVYHLIITSANDCLDIELFILMQNLIVQDVAANDGRAIPSEYLDLSCYLQSLRGSNFSLRSDELSQSSLLSYCYSILSAIPLSLHQRGIWRIIHGVLFSSELR